jgi:AcrR family transcriptional regulator
VARTATISKFQILEAARLVFLERGFSATAVDVANRAGISSASIFKHFPTKEALFFAAMEPLPHETIWTPQLEGAIGHGDPAADLLHIAQSIAAYTSRLLPRMMLSKSVKQKGEIPHELPSPPNILGDFAAISSYIAREMALGRIRRGDPTIPAMTLIHTSVGFSMSLTLQNAADLMDTQHFLADFIALLWRSLEPSKIELGEKSV